MPLEFKLPDLGEGIHEGEIVEVLVSEGDQVEDGTLVLLVETDKATTEVPSPVAGVVKEIRVKPGDVVKVGQVMMVFDRADEKGEPGEEPSREDKKQPSGEGEEETPSGKDQGEEEEKNKGKKKETPKEKEKEEDTGKEPSEGDKKEAREKAGTSGKPPQEGPVPAAPSTRRLARELGVDLRQVTASGPGGRVMPEDVQAFARKGEEAAGEKEEPTVPKKISRDEKEAVGEEEGVKEPSMEEEAVERVALRSVRKATARRMALAWSEIPHVTHQDAADITELEAFRQKAKEKIRAQGGTLSLTVFVLKAVVAALKAFPGFNASIDMDSEEILFRKYYNIGVATDTDRGLVVPVLKNVDRKSLTLLSQELPQLVQRTREGKIDREDVTGGTFTITNIGALGGRAFTPIVNHPQAAILGLAQGRLEPVIKGDLNNYRVVPRLMLPLILGFDHRVVDGADAARFVNMVKESLQDPENLLMVM